MNLFKDRRSKLDHLSAEATCLTEHLEASQLSSRRSPPESIERNLGCRNVIDNVHGNNTTTTLTSRSLTKWTTPDAFLHALTSTSPGDLRRPRQTLHKHLKPKNGDSFRARDHRCRSVCVCVCVCVRFNVCFPLRRATLLSEHTQI